MSHNRNKFKIDPKTYQSGTNPRAEIRNGKLIWDSHHDADGTYIKRLHGPMDPIKGCDPLFDMPDNSMELEFAQ